MKKNSLDAAADALLKRFEEADKLKKLTRNGSGLASYLTGKSEIEVLIEDLRYSTLPMLFLELNKLKQFYERKTEYNDNIRNLSNEINVISEYLNKIEKTVSLKEVKNMQTFSQDLIDKYGLN